MTIIEKINTRLWTNNRKIIWKRNKFEFEKIAPRFKLIRVIAEKVIKKKERNSFRRIERWRISEERTNETRGEGRRRGFGKVRSDSIGIRIEFKFLIDRAIRSWISFIFIWIRSVLLIAQSRRPNFYRIRNLLIHL